MLQIICWNITDKIGNWWVIWNSPELLTMLYVWCKRLELWIYPLNNNATICLNREPCYYILYLVDGCPKSTTCRSTAELVNMLTRIFWQKICLIFLPWRKLTKNKQIKASTHSEHRSALLKIEGDFHNYEWIFSCMFSILHNKEIQNKKN